MRSIVSTLATSTSSPIVEFLEITRWERIGRSSHILLVHVWVLFGFPKVCGGDLEAGELFGIPEHAVAVYVAEELAEGRVAYDFFEVLHIFEWVLD
jgi:hypothetical protein